MQKFLERLKETWYGVLPILILVGIPTAIGIVIWVISNWNDIPKILERIAYLGGGSLLYGSFLILFGLIGLINAVIAFMMWAKAFLEMLDRKAKSRLWFWLPIIVVTFGWYALFKILTKML